MFKSLNYAMRHKIIFASFSLVLLCLPSLSFAGPFGLEMGMSLAQLKQAGVDLKLQKENFYEAKRMPRSIDSFELFQLWIEPGLGLCKIRAIGKTLDVNSFGDQLKAEFSSIEDLLKSGYGPNKKFDFLRRGSIWSDPNDWMMGLAKKERDLSAYWDKEEGSNMKDNITSIALEANGLSGARGYIDVIYEFDNTAACVAKSKSRKSGTL